MDSRAAAFVHYYAREGYVQHVQAVCNELIKHGSTPVLLLWRAFGLLAGGATAEVITSTFSDRLVLSISTDSNCINFSC